MIDKYWTPQDVFCLSSAVWEACALQAAVKLDLFTALSHIYPQGLTAVDLAHKIGTDPRATDMLLTALVSLNYLERGGKTVKLTEAARNYLSTDSPDYFGFIIKHMSHILPNWTNLAQAVRTGGMAAVSPSMASENEEEREAFLMGMFNTARQQADLVAKAFDLTGRKRLLDLGGGPGTYAVHFCLHYPDLTAVVFDQPTTEKFARSVFSRFNLEDRLEFMGGDFLSTELPCGFDVAWLSQILHGENPDDACKLVQRGVAALKPGGLLGIQEFIIDNDHCGPAHSALFSLNMLVQTPGGQAYTENELTEMMKMAGLTDVKRLQVQLPPGCGLMCGVKS